MNRLKTNELTVIAISVAMMIVLGTILYFVGRSLPIPGGRLLAMAPAYSFIFSAVILRVRRIGVISIISFIFGLFVIRFSIVSVLCIWISAFLADIITFLLIRNYTSYKEIYLTVPLNGFFQIWTSYIAVVFFVPASKFTQLAAIPTLLVSILIYLIGLFSSKYFIKMLEKRGLLGIDFYDEKLVVKTFSEN